MSDEAHAALLVVDVQKDFCPGGSLAVPDGDRVVEPLSRHIEEATARRWPVYASRDWHPRVTSHFKEYGGEWPVHCVENTEGAAFHDRLRLPPSTVVITKGQDPDHPGYSAFQGRTPDGRTLLEDLRERGVKRLYVGGLATDYCVKHSVLDALKEGFEVTVLGDSIAGVNLAPDDSRRAIEEMRAAGAAIQEAAHVDARLTEP